MNYIEANPMLLESEDELSASSSGSELHDHSSPPPTPDNSLVSGTNAMPHIASGQNISLRSRTNFTSENCSYAVSQATIIEEILSAHRNSDGSDTPQQLDIADFECPLCMRLFHKPVSTICGHTYCKSCLLAALRYSLMCPLCRTKLEDPSKHKYQVNIVLSNVLEKHFKEECLEREREEEQDAQELAEVAEVTPPPPEIEEYSPWGSCLIPSVRETCCVLLSCT